MNLAETLFVRYGVEDFLRIVRIDIERRYAEQRGKGNRMLDRDRALSSSVF